MGRSSHTHAQTGLLTPSCILLQDGNWASNSKKCGMEVFHEQCPSRCMRFTEAEVKVSVGGGEEVTASWLLRKNSYPRVCNDSCAASFRQVPSDHPASTIRTHSESVSHIIHCLDSTKFYFCFIPDCIFGGITTGRQRSTCRSTVQLYRHNVRPIQLLSACLLSSSSTTASSRLPSAVRGTMNLLSQGRLHSVLHVASQTHRLKSFTVKLRSLTKCALLHRDSSTPLTEFEPIYTEGLERTLSTEVLCG